MTAPSLVIVILIAVISILLLMLFKGKKRIPPSSDTMLAMGQRLEQLDRLVRQVDEMNRVFNSPRLRGGLGETLLEDLIRNRLPRDSYSFQYSFSGGQRADAVLRMGSYKVAVDAKFPLEQMKGLTERGADEEIPKGIRKIFIHHAQSIAEKYILPREGTMPFALMYIPSENIYYRVFIAGSASLLEELLAIGVLPVSPSSLFAYLQTVAYGFRGFSFSSRSREIMQLTGQIRQDFELFHRQYQIAGTHLKNFQKACDDSDSRLSALNRTLNRLHKNDS